MMVEWMIVGIIWAAAIVMIAHPIDEAIGSAAPRRLQPHCFPDSPSREEPALSGVQRDSNDEGQKRAA